MGVSGQRHAPAALLPGKSQYPLYGRLGMPQDRSRRVQIILPPLGFNPQTVQSIASHYTDWTFPAHNNYTCSDSIQTQHVYETCLVFLSVVFIVSSMCNSTKKKDLTDFALVKHKCTTWLFNMECWVYKNSKPITCHEVLSIIAKCR